MSKKNIIILLIIAFTLTVTAVTGYSETGATSGAVIMKQTVGARQLAMGGAFTAIADDINTLAYNPAGLANLRVMEVGAMGDTSFAGVSSYFLGGALPAGQLGTFGGSVAMLNAGEITINTTDENGAILSSGVTKNAGQDSLITAGFGRDLGESISVGASFKMLTSTLVEDYTATASALDFGGLYRVIYGDLTEVTVGGSIMNFGLGRLKYLDSTSDADAVLLPMTIRAGAMFLMRFGGYYGDSNSITAAVDVQLPNDSSPKANIGVEGIMEAAGIKFAARAGLRYNDGPSTIVLTIGAGLVIQEKFYIDLGIGPAGNLGSAMRASFLARFGSEGEGGEGDWW